MPSQAPRLFLSVPRPEAQPESDAGDVTVRRLNGDPYIDPVAALVGSDLDDPMED